MSSRMPPRYLPTLTEVVYPKSQEAVAELPPPLTEAQPIAEARSAADTEELRGDELVQELELDLEPEPAWAPVLESAASFNSTIVNWDAAPSEHTETSNAFGQPAQPVVPDRHALAQQLIKLVQPQLEAELRSIAMELFEAQFSALLPSLQLHIEEAVREALDHAMPPTPNRND